MAEQRMRNQWGLWTTAILLMLLVAYPLSTRPAARLCRLGHLPTSTIYLYEPLFWLRKWVPAPLNGIIYQDQNYWKLQLFFRQYDPTGTQHELPSLDD